MSGKGDKRRPMKVDRKTYDSNWEKVFGRVSISERNFNVNEKYETTVGVLFHPEDPNLTKNRGDEK